MLPFSKRLIGSIQLGKLSIGLVSWLFVFFFLIFSISFLASHDVSSVRADAPFAEEFRGTGNFGFVSGGGGTRGDPFANTWSGSTTFTITIPAGATIQKARLIWTGKSIGIDADGVELMVDTTDLGVQVADKRFIQDPWTTKPVTANNLYHETKDITSLLAPLGLSGTHDFTVSDHEHARSSRTTALSNDLNFGVGIWIVYEHPSEPLSELVVYQGLDSFYISLPTPRGPHSLVNCATYTADVVDRVADTAHMVSGVDYYESSAGVVRARSNTFWYEVGTGPTPVLAETVGGSMDPALRSQPNAIGIGGGAGGMYPLQSYSDLEWDIFNVNGGIDVPAGDSWVCFQIESGDSAGLTNYTGGAIQEASGMWNLYMLRVRPKATTSINLLSFTGHSRPDRQVTLDWETAVEVNNYGFNLYRSDTAQFPGGAPIGFVSSDKTGGNGASYQFEDVVDNYGTWYYWLEDIETGNGDQVVTTLHGPIQVQVSRFQNYYLPLISQ